MRDRFFEMIGGQRGAGRLRWHLAGKGGAVLGVDAYRGRIETSAGRLEAEVVNFVPRLGAGRLARAAGLCDDSHWCPTDSTGASSLRPEVVIIGDARKGVARTLDGPAMSARLIRRA